MRVFRVDRIEDVVLLDEPARPPAGIELRDLGEGVFQPAQEHLLVLLRVRAGYNWVADYYPTEDVSADGTGLRIALRVSEPAWVRSLVLGSGGDVEVLSPGWLAESIRADAERALAAYAAP
jgi:proteasome accessory factor C